MTGIRGGGGGERVILRKKKEMKEDYIFGKAREAWNSLGAYRGDRRRCKRYVFGNQWDDMIDVGGRRMSEYQFIREQGQNPLKNNILRRIVRNVTGAYRANYKVPTAGEEENGGNSEETEEKNRRIRRLFGANRMDSLLPRLLEEFLISGLAAVRITRGTGGGRLGKRILPVTPDNFFFHSDGYDPRGWDVDLIGEVHYVGYENLTARLCRTAEEIKRIESIYAAERDNNSLCKVTEVWYRDTETWGFIHDEKESRLYRMPMEEICRQTGKGEDPDIRSHSRTVWRSAWYAEEGRLLKSGATADRHPYVWKAYPFLDGEIHSYVGDIIDQQRYVNHLITLYDFIMKSSAKGVLLFPDESLPRGMNLQDVANEWSRFNGVIPYRAQPGVPLPTQVSGNAANIGITELLKIEMQMLEDISGVSPTLQGKLETTAASGTLFAQQNQAALTSLLDVIRSFEEFVDDIAIHI